MARFNWYDGRGQLDMLISQDLLKFLSRDLDPAQLCLMREMGTDNRYVLRVRYRDVYLDYALAVPLFPTAEEVTKKCNFAEVHKALVAMARLVTPPGAASDRDWNQHPSPQILHPVAPGKYHYEW